MSLFLFSFGINLYASYENKSQIQVNSQLELFYLEEISDESPRIQNFDDNWKFYLGNLRNPHEVIFDYSNFRNISLPHDYNIEQKYTRQLEAESGYLPGGIGWYRKYFKIDENLKGKRIVINFDGVYMNSTIWINGHQLGKNIYGYNLFSFDLTNYINYSAENVIAVKVDQTLSSYWYSGSDL